MKPNVLHSEASVARLVVYDISGYDPAEAYPERAAPF